MNPATYEEMIAYGKNLIAAYPSTSAEDMKKALETKFVGGKDVLPLATVGCVCNPIEDYLAILSIVWNSLRKVITQDKAKLVPVQEQIDRAVACLMALK
jgi:hypothetical protein